MHALYNIIPLVSIGAGSPTYFTSCPTSPLPRLTQQLLVLSDGGWVGKGEVLFSTPKAEGTHQIFRHSAWNTGGA